MRVSRAREAGSPREFSPCLPEAAPGQPQTSQAEQRMARQRATDLENQLWSLRDLGLNSSL